MDKVELKLRQVDQNDLALTLSCDIQLRNVSDARLIARAQPLAVQRDLAVNHVEERATTGFQLELHAVARAQTRDIKRRVLMNLHCARRALPGSDGQQPAGALLGRKLLLLVRGRQPGAIRQYPHLEQLNRRVFRKVEFGMRDARARRHPLHFAGANQPGATGAVFVPQRALQYVGHDLHLAMRMRRESPLARDRVMIEDTQRPESHVVRVVVTVETEQPVRRQPVALQMKSVFGLDDLHISSSYRFYIRRNYFCGPSNARSIENAPPPLTNSATAMPIASRWYSKPSPACFPIQFIKNPYCW